MQFALSDNHLAINRTGKTGRRNDASAIDRHNGILRTSVVRVEKSSNRESTVEVHPEAFHCRSLSRQEVLPLLA